MLLSLQSLEHAKCFLPQDICMCPSACWTTLLSALCLGGSFLSSMPHTKRYLLQGDFPAWPLSHPLCLILSVTSSRGLSLHDHPAESVPGHSVLSPCGFLPCPYHKTHYIISSFCVHFLLRISEFREGRILVCLFIPMSPEQVPCWHSAWDVLVIYSLLTVLDTVLNLLF